MDHSFVDSVSQWRGFMNPVLEGRGQFAVLNELGHNDIDRSCRRGRKAVAIEYPAAVVLACQTTVHMNRSCFESVRLPATINWLTTHTHTYTPTMSPTVVPLTDYFLLHRILRNAAVFESYGLFFQSPPSFPLESRRWAIPRAAIMLTFSQSTTLLVLVIYP